MSDVTGNLAIECDLPIECDSETRTQRRSKTPQSSRRFRRCGFSGTAGSGIASVGDDAMGLNEYTIELGVFILISLLLLPLYCAIFEHLEGSNHCNCIKTSGSPLHVSLDFNQNVSALRRSTLP